MLRKECSIGKAQRNCTNLWAAASFECMKAKKGLLRKKKVFMAQRRILKTSGLVSHDADQKSFK